MPDPTPDKVTAYLAEVRERSERPLPHVTSLPIGHDGVRALMESAADVPRLLAVVEAVLALAAKHEHGATRWEDPLPVPAWIPELREAISRALLGEGGSGG